MCGRYAVKKSTLLVTNNLVKKNINVDLDQDNFNCSPGGKYPVVKSATNGKYLEMTTWGIRPSWAKDDFKSLHNARLEGIETKISFKKLILNSRAIIPCSGYYEWKKTENKKIPYYFTRTDDQDIFLAGIHENGQFTVITREANEQNREIHNRQPVIIKKSQINHKNSTQTLKKMSLNAFLSSIAEEFSGREFTTKDLVEFVTGESMIGAGVGFALLLS